MLRGTARNESQMALCSGIFITEGRIACGTIYKNCSKAFARIRVRILPEHGWRKEHLCRWKCALGQFFVTVQSAELLQAKIHLKSPTALSSVGAATTAPPSFSLQNAVSYSYAANSKCLQLTVKNNK